MTEFDTATAAGRTMSQWLKQTRVEVKDALGPLGNNQKLAEFQNSTNGAPRSLHQCLSELLQARGGQKGVKAFVQELINFYNQAGLRNNEDGLNFAAFSEEAKQDFKHKFFEALKTLKDKLKEYRQEFRSNTNQISSFLNQSIKYLDGTIEQVYKGLKGKAILLNLGSDAVKYITDEDFDSLAKLAEQSKSARNKILMALLEKRAEKQGKPDYLESIDPNLLAAISKVTLSGLALSDSQKQEYLDMDKVLLELTPGQIFELKTSHVRSSLGPLANLDPDLVRELGAVFFYDHIQKHHLNPDNENIKAFLAKPNNFLFTIREAINYDGDWLARCGPRREEISNEEAFLRLNNIRRAIKISLEAEKSKES